MTCGLSTPYHVVGYTHDEVCQPKALSTVPCTPPYRVVNIGDAHEAGVVVGGVLAVSGDVVAGECVVVHEPGHRDMVQLTADTLSPPAVRYVTTYI